MTVNGWLQIALYCAIITLFVKPLGAYMTRVFTGERTFLSPVLGPGRARPLPDLRRRREGGAALGDLCRRDAALQPRRLRSRSTRCSGCRMCCRSIRRASTPCRPDLAFNTAVSFVTNTNWQSYVPETTMSYLVQMAGLTVHNFVSAATGIALAIALIRGFARRSAQTVGNFWVDLTRCTLYVLLPISIVVGLFFVWQGMPQNLSAYVEATTLEGAKQMIAQGPVASQEAIKMLGTNGGGFFNANSAHPYENPNAITNLVQIVLIFSIGAALTNVFGRMVGDQRQGWAIFAVMGILFLAGDGHRLLGRGRRQSRLRRAPRRQHAERAAGRRQHGRQGGPLRHRQLGALRHHHDRRLVRRRQLHARQLHAARRPGAAWSTSCSARSSSAASAPVSTACCCSPSSRCSSPG